MTHSRLQLVFLGQLVDGSPEAIRERTLQVHEQVASDPLELTLWHDLDAEEAGRVERCMQSLRPAPDAAAMPSLPVGETFESSADASPHALETAEAAPSAAVTPFPVLVDIEEPTPPPVKTRTPSPTALRPIRPAKPATQTSAASGAAASTNRVRCPNCGERQTMRVMCRGCASFLEVALKAKAERDAQAKAKARSGGLLAMLGL